MVERTYFHDYLEYIAVHPETKARMETVCNAWEGEGPSFAVNWTPVGKIYVYPEHLVFLTASNAKPGHVKHAISQFWDEVSPYLKASKWANRPETLIWDVVKSINSDKKDEEKEFVEKSLASPNSFAIPLSSIQRVVRQHNWKGNFIIIYTNDNKYTLWQNINAEAPDPLRYVIGTITGNKPLKKFSHWAMMKSSWAFISGRWNEELAGFLIDIANKNQSKKA